MWGYLMFWGITLLVTEVQSEGSEVFAEAGSQAVLPCVLRPPSPSAAAIRWSKTNGGGTVWRKERSGLEYWGQGKIQRMRCPHSEVLKGDYSLHIQDVREEDGGVYTCKVEDEGQLVHHVVTLRVIKVAVSLLAPVEGDNVSIGCNVTPWPRGATVRWGLNGSPFTLQDYSQIREVFTPYGDAFKSVMKGKASQSLAGDWTCIVRYQGKVGLAAKSLSVTGIVYPSNESTKVYAAVGSAVVLPCVFTPGVIPSDPAWERLDAGSISPFTPPCPPPSLNVSFQHPWDRSVNVCEVGPEDGGRYRCSGTVKGRRLARNVQLVTAKVDSYTPSIRRAPLTLTCHLSDHSGVTNIEWVRVTYDSNGNQSVSSIQKGKVLKLNRVTEENSGEWACRFYGKQGILGNVTHHIQLTSRQTGDSDKGSSGNIATVIGLSFLLLVLLMILAQTYKNHQRRKRILQYPGLETIVHAISNEREERERNQVKDEEISK